MKERLLIMAIKRYDSTELVEICKGVFFDYLLKGDSYFSHGDWTPCDFRYPSVIHLIHKEYEDTLAENMHRQKEIVESIEYAKQSYNDSILPTLFEHLRFLHEEFDLIQKTNMKEQKKRYKKTKVMDYARSKIRIPLNKLINSYYDDFTLEVFFYDDVCTLNGKFNKFIKLETEEERREFIEKNIEVADMSLLLFRQDGTILSIIHFYGDKVGKAGDLLGTTSLDYYYSDLKNLKLKDTMRIWNNDLRQIFQSKIDLDNEDMTALQSLIIRGSEYILFSYLIKENNRTYQEFFIRYVCPSTGRVYFNKVVIPNLRVSDYFKEGNYSSYIKSWWSIMHLGARVDGNPVISC